LNRARLSRPPLWLSVSLLLSTLALGVLSTVHRRSIETRFARSVVESQAAPFEIRRLRRELSEMELDEKALRVELQARIQYVKSLESSHFYIVLDTQKRKLRLRYGDRVVREANLEAGPGRIIQGPSGQRWTFAPLTGAFRVSRKLEGASWRVPPWVYAMKGMRIPRRPPAIPDGLGRYVLVVTGDSVIHSPPARESPLRGAKPGSFMVPEEELAAIWKRVEKGTRVYIF
jgi:hypothetical protein